MTAGEKLSSRRKELGLTLQDVADACGVSKGTVHKWESGQIGNMRRDKVSVLAKVLQVDVDYIIDDQENEKSLSGNEAEKAKLIQQIMNAIDGMTDSQAQRFYDVIHSAQLPDADWDLIRSMIENLMKRQQPK